MKTGIRLHSSLLYFSHKITYLKQFYFRFIPDKQCEIVSIALCAMNNWQLFTCFFVLKLNKWSVFLPFYSTDSSWNDGRNWLWPWWHSFLRRVDPGRNDYNTTPRIAWIGECKCHCQDKHIRKLRKCPEKHKSVALLLPPSPSALPTFSYACDGQ